MAGILSLVTVVLMLVAFGVILFYGIILIVRAFKIHVLWGLAYLFVPFASIVFLFKHWDVAKQPFIRSMMGFGVVMIVLVIKSLVSA